MSPIIIFIVIALLIKKGVVDGRGFSDAAKVLSTLFGIFILFSILSSPLFWALLGLILIGGIAGIIAFINKTSNKKRAEQYGWNTEEYQAKYAEAVERFKAMYREQRENWNNSNMSETQRRARELRDEKRARDAAKEEVDAEFMARAEQAKRDLAAAAASAAANNSNTKSNHKLGTSVVKSSILPKASGRRTKIVKKFNTQYDLFLTDEQIKRIVDASYMSNAWKREVEAMFTKYDSVYQWLHGDTAYLRAYLRAFTVQDVTSDFKQQMQIVMDSFEEIFAYSDSISGLSIEQRINSINSKFMTNFDEITYMIAYRYLESLGLHHELDRTQVNRVDNTFDDLVSKYENMSTEGVDGALDSLGTQSTTH